MLGSLFCTCHSAFVVLPTGLHQCLGYDRSHTLVSMASQGEYDALVLSYTHLKSLPRQDDALHTLRKVASVVKPIMRARGWKVSELAEFFPDQQNLLGEACNLIADIGFVSC